jgi:3'-phosphoadenosine 5'-phosphosulfate sulfotransferase (PAPS reductase)/FAD synthetase
MKPDLNSYDQIIVAFSGGKDSTACVLQLLEMGADRDKLELWHHDIDGNERQFMDWTCTPDYCRKFAAALELKLYFSWKQGGFRREMMRENTATAPTFFEGPDGLQQTGGNGPAGTRRKFPQVSGNLAVRWCSAYLKIDVSRAALNNQIRFRNSRTLFVTGERAEESSARAKYRTFEPHMCDRREGKLARHIDHWRPVHSWTETQVWDTIAKWKIQAHPCYYLGWGRCSCQTCIFGSPDQWASVRAISRQQFDAIAEHEECFGCTIHRELTVNQNADKGHAFPAVRNLAMIKQAKSIAYLMPIFVDKWELPAGAFGDSAGPS